MRILLISVGTRGDVEPFLAIAEILKEHGQDVVGAFPEQFRDLAADLDMRFRSLGTEFIDLIESEDGRIAMGGKGSFLNKAKAYIRLYRNSAKINRDLVHRQHQIVAEESPDRIVFSGKAVYPFLWAINNPHRAILVSAVPCVIHYVKHHPHVGFNRDFGPFLNKLTYCLANTALMHTALTATKDLRKAANISGRRVKQALLSERIIYTISPSLFSRPEYWPPNAQVLGYHEREKALNWRPSRELEEFLGKHTKILLITFGSALNPAPEKKTALFLDILKRNQIPAIINTSAGGLTGPKEYDTNLIRFVKQIPYDWVLPKIYGVIHHGGSGTTHMALKYGCASMIIPHIIDQYLWNDLVSGLGAGPKGVAVNKMTRQNVEYRILDLFHNQSYKAKALELSQEMRKERFREQIYSTIVQ